MCCISEVKQTGLSLSHLFIFNGTIFVSFKSKYDHVPTFGECMHGFLSESVSE